LEALQDLREELDEVKNILNEDILVSGDGHLTETDTDMDMDEENNDHDDVHENDAAVLEEQEAVAVAENEDEVAAESLTLPTRIVSKDATTADPNSTKKEDD
jgi:hypothetical protein